MPKPKPKPKPDDVAKDDYFGIWAEGLREEAKKKPPLVREWRDEPEMKDPPDMRRSLPPPPPDRQREPLPRVLRNELPRELPPPRTERYPFGGGSVSVDEDLTSSPLRARVRGGKG